MATIKLLATEPGVVAAEVEEGSEVTGHCVVVPDGFIDDLDLHGTDEVAVARETVQILLGVEPAVDVPRELSVAEVARNRSGFTDELVARLRAAGAHTGP